MKHRIVMKLILPPPTLLKIIDKTAFYVSKHGKILESKIKKKYKKFGFLDSKNIFYPYYIHKLKFYLYQKKKSINKCSNLNLKNNRFFNIFFKNLNIKKYKMLLNVKKKRLHQLISTIRIFIKKSTSQTNSSRLNNNLEGVFKLDLDNSYINFTQLIYQFINQNHQSLVNLTKLIKFNKIEILQNEIKTDKIEKFKSTFNSKSFISKKIYSNMILWDNFTIVKTIDFLENNMEKLGKPLELKQLV